MSIQWRASDEKLYYSGLQMHTTKMNKLCKQGRIVQDMQSYELHQRPSMRLSRVIHRGMHSTQSGKRNTESDDAVPGGVGATMLGVIFGSS